MEKRRIVLITRAREIVTNYVQSKGKIVTAETYNNIVVGTATKMVKVYLEGRTAKEASQYPSSMLESSVPKIMTDEASATKGAGGTKVLKAPYLHVQCACLPKWPAQLGLLSIQEQWTRQLPQTGPLAHSLGLLSHIPPCCHRLLIANQAIPDHLMTARHTSIKGPSWPQPLVRHVVCPQHLPLTCQ